MKKWQHAMALTAVFSVGVLLGVLFVPAVFQARADSGSPQRRSESERDGSGSVGGRGGSSDASEDESSEQFVVKTLRRYGEETAQEIAAKAAQDPEYRSWLMSEDPDKIDLEANMFPEERRLQQDIIRRAQKIVRGEK